MLWNGQRDLRGWRHGELKASLYHQVCTYENEGCCLPRISFKYRSLLDLLRGSERGSWAASSSPATSLCPNVNRKIKPRNGLSSALNSLLWQRGQAWWSCSSVTGNRSTRRCPKMSG